MKVLIIAAHMDDEVLGPGAAVARHVDQGDDVVVCVVTRRAYDHTFDTAAIAEERRDCERARRRLGYREVHHLGLRDELLDDRLLDILVPLEEVVADFRPEIVYTHHHGDLNQDHRMVFHASLVACRPLSDHPVPRLVCYEVPSSTEQMPGVLPYAFQPNHWIAVSENLLQRKIKAMEEYRREIRQFPHPRSAEGIEILARKRGMEVGVRAAEAFVVVRDVWLPSMTESEDASR